MRILITGGAGFVGSQLGLEFRQRFPQSQVVAFDNLRRRGSELNIPRLRDAGVTFVHGDIRNPTDLHDLTGNFDLLLECSAEPSVVAGLEGSPNYLLQTNLQGTLNALELTRTRGGTFVFLSTSRVYSIEPLLQLPLVETATRLTASGKFSEGIDETFPVHLPRSLYGASKLASELVIQEYGFNYGVPVIINRCSNLFGPGQFGKTDQGVFSLWLLRHEFGLPLTYTGFGAEGKQVRDLLHPRDLFRLLEKQFDAGSRCHGKTYNVGGGIANSSSLLEFTELCQKLTEKSVAIERRLQTNPVDVPWFVADTSKVRDELGWSAEHSVPQIALETLTWVREYKNDLQRVLI